MKSRIVVAIPVKDEEDHIAGCVTALLAQTAPVDDIVLLVNNCIDRTVERIRAAADGYAGLHLVEKTLSGIDASAGGARRLALQHAAAIAGDGIILTTDADGAAPPNWVAANLAAIAAGAEVVCGRAEVEPEDAARIPVRLHHDHMREVDCLTLLDEIDAIINPDPFDPWPRHQQHSGASIAMTGAALRRAGGPPDVAQAEDRILVELLRLVDARVRHVWDAPVVVSGRLEGRAVGGMADTIKRRMTTPDVLADDTLEPAVDAYRRALAKSTLRRLWLANADGATLAKDLLIPEATMEAALSAPYFGVAWAEMQRLSPVLHRRRLAVADLERETRQAAALRDELINGGIDGVAAGHAVAG